MTEDEVRWLEDLPFTYTLRGLRPVPGGRLARAEEGADAVVVHAGLVPGRPLREQELQDMVMMRNLEQVAEEQATDSEQKEAGQERKGRLSPLEGMDKVSHGLRPVP